MKTDHQTLTISVPEAARLLGINRMLAYSLARKGEIPAVRLGHRIVVPRAALERMLAEAGTSVEVKAGPTANQAKLVRKDGDS